MKFFKKLKKYSDRVDEIPTRDEITIRDAIENLRILERADNFKKFNQVAPQTNCDLIEKSIGRKYKDLVDVILKELYHNKCYLIKGNFKSADDIERIKGSIDTLERLVWYIENNNDTEVQE